MHHGQVGRMASRRLGGPVRRLGRVVTQRVDLGEDLVSQVGRGAQVKLAQTQLVVARAPRSRGYTQ